MKSTTKPLNLMCKKNILILAPYTSLPNETSFNRFLYLAYLFSKEYNVTLLTSSFNHTSKTIRDTSFFENLDLPFKIELISEPGYTKNVSLKRLYSHKVFTQNMENWLKKKQSNDIDLFYSAFPLIKTNLILGKYKARFNYKIIIDIQDIWPDSISSAFPIAKKLKFLLYPIRKRSERAYKISDGIIAVSKTYLNIARKANPHAPALPVYIGADKALISKTPSFPKEKNVIKLLYIGTLSHSYDVETVILAMNTIIEEKIEFHIFGDGPRLHKLKIIAKKNTYFHGLKPYIEMIAFAKSCDILINPIVASAQQSITNKLSDYFLLKLPIINSQQSKEVTSLISKTNGYNYEAGSAESFIKALYYIIKNKKRTNCHSELINKLFDRNLTYPNIVDFTKNILLSPTSPTLKKP